jgi:proline dehydrogenase
VLRRLLLFAADRRWMRRLITRYPLSRAVAWRFVAGETADTALRAVGRLRERGVMSTLDLLGESVDDAATAAASTERYLALLEHIRRSGLPSHISIKLTQLGLDLGEEVCRSNLERILRRAGELGIFVRFDMESSAYTQRTLDLYRAVRPAHPECGVVIQSYLLRSARDVEDLIALGARVRLCKGAYLEPADVAYQRKADVDASYLRLMERLLSEGNYPAIATHDPAMIAHARAFTRTRNIPAAAWEFQMLYGVRRDLQESLAAQGYNVRCYIPFGTEWYPYLMRRLAERPANLAFILRNVLRERGRPGAAPTGSAS